MLEDDPYEETWRSLQPNTDILTTVLKDRHYEGLSILSLLVFELGVLKALDVVQCTKMLDLLNVLGNVA